MLYLPSYDRVSLRPAPTPVKAAAAVVVVAQAPALHLCWHCQEPADNTLHNFCPRCATH